MLTHMQKSSPSLLSCTELVHIWYATWLFILVGHVNPYDLINILSITPGYMLPQFIGGKAISYLIKVKQITKPIIFIVVIFYRYST